MNLLGLRSQKRATAEGEVADEHGVAATDEVW